MLSLVKHLEKVVFGVLHVVVSGHREVQKDVVVVVGLGKEDATLVNDFRKVELARDGNQVSDVLAVNLDIARVQVLQHLADDVTRVVGHAELDELRQGLFVLVEDGLQRGTVGGKHQLVCKDVAVLSGDQGIARGLVEPVPV